MEIRFGPLMISVRRDRGTDIAALAAARVIPLASSSSTSKEMAQRWCGTGSNFHSSDSRVPESGRNWENFEQEVTEETEGLRTALVCGRSVKARISISPFGHLCFLLFKNLFQESRQMAKFVISILMVVQCVSWIFTSATSASCSFSHSGVIRPSLIRLHLRLSTATNPKPAKSRVFLA